MNTPSHFIMTAALDKALPRVPIVKGAVLIGSVAPDLPLWMLSIGGMIYYQHILGWSGAEAFHMMFDELYFNHPVWIVLHNTLHSPVILLTALAVLWRKRRNIGSWQRWWFWFFSACLLHSVVDIFTHADDGPLLLFPLNWSIRFNSPVSYWDSRYYGDRFQQFELMLNAVLSIYLLKDWLNRSVRKWVRHY